MPEEVRHFTATIPAGTPIAAPVTVPISFPPRVVRSVYWRVPHGPMGTFGWRLSMGGVQVIPALAENPGFAGDLFVVANDEHGTWLPENLPDSGAWAVTGYNTGTHPHSVYLAFELDMPAREDRLVPLIPFHDLASAPDLSAAGPPVPGR